MTWMLNLINVLELVIHRFNQCSLAQQNLVHQLRQAIFHLALGLGNEFHPPLKQLLKQGSRDITAITKELAYKALGQFRNRLTVIGIDRGEIESE